MASTTQDTADVTIPIFAGIPNEVAGHKVFVMGVHNDSVRIGIANEPIIDVQVGDTLGSLTDWKVTKIFKQEAVDPQSPPGTGSGQKVLEISRVGLLLVPSPEELARADAEAQAFIDRVAAVPESEKIRMTSNKFDEPIAEVVPNIPQNALVTLNGWLSAQGSDISASILDAWEVTPYNDSFIFSPKGVRTNKLYIIKGQNVGSFSPATTTIEDAYQQLA